MTEEKYSVVKVNITTVNTYQIPSECVKSPLLTRSLQLQKVMKKPEELPKKKTEHVLFLEMGTGVRVVVCRYVRNPGERREEKTLGDCYSFLDFPS